MPTPNADQLHLRLVAETPRSPLDLRPMLPRPAARLPIDGRHIFDLSWGGARMLVHVGTAGPRLFVHGRDLTAAFPELAGALEGIVVPGTVLDGEIVVPDGSGRLDRPALRSRLRAMGAHAASPMDGGAAAFVISDMPWYGGGSLLAEPLSGRRARLAALGLDRPYLTAPAPIVEGGQRLLDAARAHGLAAVVAKRLDSPYLPGVRSRLWCSVRVGARIGDGLIADPGAGEPGNDPRGPVLALLRTLPLGGDA